MKRRIPPSEGVKQEDQAVLRGQDEGGHPLDSLVRLGAQYLLQRALEVEVQEFLGRGYYRHGGLRQGWRNGYEPKALKTPVGILTMAVPQVRATAEPFRSRVAAALRPRSEALKRLVRELDHLRAQQTDVGSSIKGGSRGRAYATNLQENWLY